MLAKATAEINADIGVEVGGPLVTFESVDLTSPTDVDALVDRVRENHGRVDVIINNAGGASRLPTGTLEEVAVHWRAAFDVNVLSAVLLTQGLLPLLARPGGRIVLVSSMASRSGGGASSYGAAKAALNGWVLSLAAQLGPQGITANVVAPGYTPRTELFGDGLPQALHDQIVRRIAVGRPGEPEDVAAAVRYLASPDASFVTGQVLEVAGGSVPPA